MKIRVEANECIFKTIEELVQNSLLRAILVLQKILHFYHIFVEVFCNKIGRRIRYFRRLE